MKLYELADKLERVMAEVIDPETGEITEDGAEKLEALEMDLEEKARQTLRYRRGVVAEAEAVGQEIERLQKRVRQLQSHADFLEKYVVERLVRHFGERYVLEDVRAPQGKALRWTESKAVVPDGVPEETALALLPPNLVRTKVTHSPDKLAIAKELQQGEVKGWKIEVRVWPKVA